MPPYNMTREEMLYAVCGGAIVAFATSLFFYIFGKLFSVTSFLRQLIKLKYNSDFAIRMTALSGIIFSAAFVKVLYHEHFIKFNPFDNPS